MISAAGMLNRTGAESAPRIVSRAVPALDVFDCYVSTVEEPEINPSLLVCLSGCNWSCAFCNVSRRMRSATAKNRVDELHAIVAEAASHGARSVQFTGGEPCLQARALERLLASRLPLPVVLNTALPTHPNRMRALLGRIDRFIASLKFGNDECAVRLAGPRVRASRGRLLALKALGIPLIVRHLVLPGHLECCTIPTLEWLARNLPGDQVTLLTAYVPPASASRAPELLRCLDDDEVEAATGHARRLGLRLSSLPCPGSAATVSIPGKRGGHPRDRSRDPVPAAMRCSESDDVEIIVDAKGRICFAGFGLVAGSLVRMAGLVPVNGRRK